MNNAAPLAVRATPSEAMQLAACFAQALESYLEVNGGAAARVQLAGVVRNWVPRWRPDVPPVLADALIEGLARQGKVITTRHYVGITGTVERWRIRFARYPHRFRQPPEQVARDFDVPVAAVVAMRVLTRLGQWAVGSGQ